MKLVHKSIDKGSGHVVVTPEYPEDMWHLYNLIRVGDNVQSTTIRKVQTESATGSSTSSRVRTTLKINVETIDFDTQGGMLRLKGKNVEENPYVKVRSAYCRTVHLYTLSLLLSDGRLSHTGPGTES